MREFIFLTLQTSSSTDCTKYQFCHRMKHVSMYLHIRKWQVFLKEIYVLESLNLYTYWEHVAGCCHQRIIICKIYISVCFGRCYEYFLNRFMQTLPSSHYQFLYYLQTLRTHGCVRPSKRYVQTQSPVNRVSSARSPWKHMSITVDEYRIYNCCGFCLRSRVFHYIW